ncbi:hypothetical protein VTN77DRAFT_6605 [Rasamsonia byssochlamydoides]|uniref:uncharacterized protein n=1 Tax=Rasamsonia byssochlamydoides TaxID=89139 RepID=UPI003743E12C
MGRSTRPGKTLAEQLADLEDPAPKDFDPEDPDLGAPDSDDESASEVDENAGREHYQAVGKSKLRKPETVKLGKEYAAARVSREALEADDSDDDPFRRRGSDEDDLEGSEEEDSEEEEGEDEEGEDEEEEEEDDISGESEEEHTSTTKKPQRRSKKTARPTDDVSVDGMETDESDGDEGSDGALDEESDEEDDISDDFSDSDEESSNEPNGVPVSDEREELRRLMATDQKTVAATISQAAKADAAKGMAVKQQRSTFDALLNARIKLQKGLMAINELPSTLEESAAVDEDAIKSAESAALALWSTLEELRLTLADFQSKDPSKKRKRPPPVSSTTSSESLWKRMTELESESVPHRRAILDKWSLKVRGSSATLPNSRGKLLGSGAGQQTITAVLDAHIASESGDRANKRARVASTANSDGASEPIYDDTVFYQSLLRDLVEQRMSSSDALTNGIDSLHVQLPVNPVSGMRKDKVKKVVDTKASKGRKMRYNVHEKLQNFMAPEDRGTWSLRAREEFFASLLGRTASGVLGEDSDEGDGANGADSDEDLEESGLRLFRN